MNKYKEIRNKLYISLIKRLSKTVNKDVTRIIVREMSSYEIDYQKKKHYFDKFSTIESTAQVKVDVKLMGETWGKPLKEI